MPFIAALEGLRGIAFLLVFVAHASQFVNTPYQLSGKEGLFLFFVLSGYLVTKSLVYSMEHYADKPLVIINYVTRRVFRIYPMYIVALLFLPAITKSGKPLELIWKHLSLQIGLEHFWSIAVELKYYALLPFVALLLYVLVRKNRQLFFAVLCLFFLIYGFMYQNISAAVAPRQLTNELSIWLYLPAFIMGSATSFVPQLKGRWRRMIETYHMELFFTLLFLFLLSSLLSYDVFMFGDYTLSYYLWLMLYSAFWSFIIYILVHLSNPLTKIFENRYLRIVGRVSFSAYLWHMSIFLWFDIAGEHGMIIPALIKIPLVFTLTMLLAALTYRYIEKPFLKISLLQTKHP